MKKILTCLFALGVLSALFIACDRDDDDDSPSTNTYQFTIIPMYNGEAMQTYKEYPYGDDEKITFTRIKFFISDLVLSKDGEEAVNLPIQSFNFEADFSEKEAAERGNSIDLGALTPGQYQLSFGIGVNDALNAQNPSDFSTDHPLGDGSDYWGPWGSYIFTKHEGIHKGAQDSVTTFIYHTGSDACYNTLEQMVELTASNDEIVLSVDFAQVFVEEGGALKNIPEEPSLHNLSQSALAVFFCDNIEQASTIDLR